MSLLLWGWLALIALEILQRTAGMLLFDLLAGGDFDRTRKLYGAIMLLFGLANVGALVLVVVGLSRLAAIRSIPELSGRAIAAMVLECAHAAWVLFIVVVSAIGEFGDQWLLPFSVWRVATPVALAIAGAGLVVSATALLAIGRAAETLLPIGLVIALAIFVGWEVGLPIYRNFVANDPESLIRNEWLWFIFGLAASVGGSALFLLLVGGALRAVNAAIEPPNAPPPTGWGPTPEWFPAARGLGLYRTALIVRVLVIAIGAGLILFALVTRAASIAVAMAIAVPLGAIVADVMMIVGLVGYAKVPRVSGARESAWIALALHAIALMVGLFSVALLLVTMFKAAGDWHSSYDVDDRLRVLQKLQLLEMAGQVIGLGAVLVLISSLKRVAGFVGARLVAARATPVVAMIAVTGVAVFVQRLLAGNPRAAGMGILVIGIGVVFLAVTALLMYVGFVGRVRAVMSEGHPGDPSPDTW